MECETLDVENDGLKAENGRLKAGDERLRKERDECEAEKDEYKRRWEQALEKKGMLVKELEEAETVEMVERV